ncbi:hypothetical protein Trydic_g17732 [Trypoxylus dichotomus]
MSKKIIIPKGLVNPNETTVIEIPAELSEERELIASPISCPTTCTRSSEARPNLRNTYNVPESEISCPGGSMFRSMQQTYSIIRSNESVGLPPSPSFKHPQATSTPRPKDLTYSVDDSSIFNTASIDPRTFETSMYDSSLSDSGGRSSPKSWKAGETYVDPPLPYRVIKKTSKSFIRRSMPYQDLNNMASGGPCPAVGRTFTRPPDLNKTRPVHPGQDMTVFFPQIASTPIDVKYSTIYGSSLCGVSPEQSYSTSYDSYSDKAASQGRFGRTQTVSPAVATAGGRTYNIGQAQNIGPAANRTYNFGRTQNICPAIAGKTYNFGRTQNVCLGSGAKTFNFGKTRTMSPDSFSIGAPVATSTPQRNQTYTQVYDSSLFRSTSFEPGTFGTIDNTYPDRGGAGSRTYNFGRTQPVFPGSRPLSRSITRIVKKSSKTFTKPPPQSSDIGALGAAYLNTTRNMCPPCNSTFTKPGPSALNQTNVVKKTSRTMTIQTACDGSKTKVIHEMTSLEPERSGTNRSVVNDVQSKLEEIENTERAQLAENLKTYQDARRNLMTNTTYNLGEQNK